MLEHMSSRPYQVAADEASARAKDKLGEIIERGKTSGMRVIEKVMTEVPKDQIVKGNVINFYSEVDDNDLPPGILASFPQHIDPPMWNQNQTPVTIADTLEATELANQTKERDVLSLHKHALSQICQRVGLPWKYAQALQDVDIESWGLPLLAHNLNELYSHQNSRYLLRSYDGQLRGFLSDRYRRLDSRPLVDAFAGACRDIGAVPVEGYATDTKVALKAMLPIIFEPAPNEVVAFYVYWGNSDYGNGAHELKVGILRLWCTNHMIMDDVLRQVHIGKRLSENISWSQRTYDLDTKAVASAIKDMVSQSLSQDRTTQLCDAIKNAHEENIDATKAISKFKKDMNKGEVQKVVEAFNSPDVENLPPGNTMWRLSNAISWVAGKTEDTERKLDLMKVAGKAMAWVQ